MSAEIQLGSSSKVIQIVPQLMLSVRDLGNSWRNRLYFRKHYCEFKRALKMLLVTSIEVSQLHTIKMENKVFR